MIPNISRTFAVDLAERAGWTFVQAFVAAASLVIVGANTQNVVHLSFWQQIGAAGLGAGVGAVTSLIKGVTAGLFTGTASTSKTVAAAVPDTAGLHTLVSTGSTGTVTLAGGYGPATVSYGPNVSAQAPTVPVDAADVLAQADAIHPAPPAPPA